MPDPITGHEDGQQTCEFCGENGRAEAEGQAWGLLAIMRDHGCTMSDAIDILIHAFVRVYGSAAMLDGLLAQMEQMAPTLRTVVEPMLREALARRREDTPLSMAAVPDRLKPS